MPNEQGQARQCSPRLRCQEKPGAVRALLQVDGTLCALRRNAVRQEGRRWTCADSTLGSLCLRVLCSCPAISSVQKRKNILAGK
eukprot:1828644-Prymnesium_polylepis.1